MFKTLGTEQGRIDFSQNILSMGPIGPAIIIALAICKSFLIFLPAEPLEILSGACFGTVMGTIYVLCGYAFSVFIVVHLTRKLGNKFIDACVPQEKFIKAKKFIKEHPYKVEMIIVLFYLLPIIPKDIIPYLSGVLKITQKKFMAISTIARIPAIISSTFAGSRLLIADYKSIAIVYLCTYTVSGIVFLMYYFNRNRKDMDSI